MKETAEQQAANRELRKGTKRPEHGAWPVADLKKRSMAKKMTSSEKAKGGKGPSNKERARMQAEVKAHAATLPPEKKNQYHGNWD